MRLALGLLLLLALAAPARAADTPTPRTLYEDGPEGRYLMEGDWLFRVEAWSDGLDRCDVVCARALAPLAVLCEYAAPLLRQHGLLVAWKGAVADAEAVDGAAAAAHLGLEADAPRSVVPFPGSERRTLHVLRKVAPTPQNYPRRPGIAAKRPLSARNLR
jgi:hypothetical protein